MMLRILVALCAFVTGGLLVRADDNILTAAEKAAGWQLLFDGRTLDGWRGYGIQGVPPGWEVKDGTLRSVAIASGAARLSGAHPQGIDLITVRTFTDFELSWDWRVSYGGNNGVNVLVYELGSEQVKAGIARSKFKDESGFGQKITGPILLVATAQSGRECWIRNLKIRDFK